MLFLPIGLLGACQPPQQTLAAGESPKTGAGETPYSVPVQYETLGNGLKVVMFRDRIAPIITVAWQHNRRWVLNTVAVFAGIHFYTQWFENLETTPGTVPVAGLIALGFAFGLKSLKAVLTRSA